MATDFFVHFATYNFTSTYSPMTRNKSLCAGAGGKIALHCEQKNKLAPSSWLLHRQQLAVAAEAFVRSCMF